MSNHLGLNNILHHEIPYSQWRWYHVVKSMNRRPICLFHVSQQLHSTLPLYRMATSSNHTIVALIPKRYTNQPFSQYMGKNPQKIWKLTGKNHQITGRWNENIISWNISLTGQVADLSWTQFFSDDFLQKAQGKFPSEAFFASTDTCIETDHIQVQILQRKKSRERVSPEKDVFFWRLEGITMCTWTLSKISNKTWKSESIGTTRQLLEA